MNFCAALTVLVLMCGCASHGTRVRCDGRLEAINTPVPATQTLRPAKAGIAAPPRAAEEDR